MTTVVLTPSGVRGQALGQLPVVTGSELEVDINIPNGSPLPQKIQVYFDQDTWCSDQAGGTASASTRAFVPGGSAKNYIVDQRNFKMYLKNLTVSSTNTYAEGA